MLFEIDNFLQISITDNFFSLLRCFSDSIYSIVPLLRTHPVNDIAKANWRSSVVTFLSYVVDSYMNEITAGRTLPGLPLSFLGSKFFLLPEFLGATQFVQEYFTLEQIIPGFATLINQLEEIDALWMERLREQK